MISTISQGGFKSAAAQFVFFMFAMLLCAPAPAKAGGEAQVINIEAAMRAWQERCVSMGDFPSWWRNNRDNKVAGLYPEDGFYGEALLDKEYAAGLVNDLYYEAMNANGVFISGAIAKDIPWEGYHQLPFYDEINATNYVEVFKAVVDFINQLKLRKAFAYAQVDDWRFGESVEYGRVIKMTQQSGFQEALDDFELMPNPTYNSAGTRVFPSDRPRGGYGYDMIYFAQIMRGVTWGQPTTTLAEWTANVSWETQLWHHSGRVRVDTPGEQGVVKIYKEVLEGSRIPAYGTGGVVSWNDGWGAYGHYMNLDSRPHTVIEPFGIYKTTTAGSTFIDNDKIIPPLEEVSTFPGPVPFREFSLVRLRYWKFYAFVESSFRNHVRDYYRTQQVKCVTCDSKTCKPGRHSSDNNCIDVSVGLGNAGTRSAGSLNIFAEVPSDELASPSSLRLRNTYGTATVYATDSQSRQYIRQVVAEQALADIVIIDDYSYRIDFYKKSQVGAANGDGIYSLANSPYQSLKVENPLRTIPLVELTVTDFEGTTEKAKSHYVWSTLLADWELTKSAGLQERKITRIPQPSPGTGLRQVVVEERDESNHLISKRKLTYKVFPWNEGADALNADELIEEVVDPDGAALVSTFDYYVSTDESTGAYEGRLKLTTLPNGFWERTQYFDGGGATYVTSPWNNTGPSANGPVQFHHRKVSATDPSLYSIEKGFEDATGKYRTSLRFERHDFAQTITYDSREVQGSTYYEPAFDETSPDYLKSIRSYYDPSYLDGSFAGRVFREVDADGTGRVYAYRYVDGDIETTVYAGALTAEYKAESWPTEPPSGVFPSDVAIITQGTKTITVTNRAGEVIEQTVIDVVSGETVSYSLATVVDEFGRVTARSFHDETSEEFFYDCCGLKWHKGREGIRTDYYYDDFGVLKETVRAGVTTKTYEEYVGGIWNSVTTRTGQDKPEVEIERVGRDLAGRTTFRREFGMRTTSYNEVYQPTGETVKTTVLPGGGTRIETYYRDGKLKSMAGTAAAPMLYEYGYETTIPYHTYYNSTDGFYSKEIRIGDAGQQTEWTKTIFDSFSRPVFKISPGYYEGTSYLIWEDYAYATNTTEPKLIAAGDADAYARLYEYNDLGEISLEVQDIDWGWEIEIDGTDRVKRITRSIDTRADGAKVRRTLTEIWTEDESADPGKTVTIDVSLDGLTKWQTIKDLETDKELTTKSVTSFDRTTATRTETTTYPDQTSLVTTYINGRLQSNVRRNSDNVTVAQVSYQYDGYGRLEHVVDSAYGTTSYTYHDDDQIKTTVTPDPDLLKTGAGYDAQTTEMVYDDAGRLWKTILPDTRIEIRKYYPTGKLKLLYGGDNYPRKYVYDSQGRMKTLTTWKNFNPTTETGSGEAVTTWNYHPDRGWLESKVLPATTVYDALGVASVVNPTVSYTYTEGGRVKIKTGARGITTTYGYNDAGELWTLTYSDSTPGVTFTYNREGRIETVVDAVGILTRTYSLTGAIEDETYSGTGALSGQVIERTFDDQDRLDTLSFGGGAYSTDWGYDTAGRVDTISQGAYTAAYSYRPNSVVTEGVTYKQGVTIRGSIDRKQDAIGRVWRADTYAGTTLVARRGYAFDQANRRVEAETEDERKWVYGYNGKGEIISAEKKQGPDDPSPDAVVPGYAFGYDFDDIGNRKTATTNGRVETYVANLLNQYAQRTSSITNGTVIDVRGEADATAKILVNDASATRVGNEFYAPAHVPAGNAEVKIQAVGGTPPLVATELRGLRVTPSNTSWEYDLDGNTRSSGPWSFEWDGENRLKAAEISDADAATVAGLPARQRLEFRYDAFGRRIQKIAKNWSATIDDWDEANQEVVHYLYDGWNIIAELNGNEDNAIIRSYVWGTDVSNSYQGAGGIGGLLWANVSSGTHAPGYDGNGNVILWLGLADGIVTGAAEYSPFGEPLDRAGVAREIVFGFSTKYLDSETGLSYYGFRYYDPSTGRWLSRDPIGEAGGVNLYGMVGNDAINGVDLYGLANTQDVIKALKNAEDALVKFGNCEKIRAYLQCVLKKINADLNPDAVRDSLAAIDAALKEFKDAGGSLEDIAKYGERGFVAADFVVKKFAESRKYEVIYKGKSLGFIPDRIRAQEILDIYGKASEAPREGLEALSSIGGAINKVVGIGSDISTIAGSDDGFGAALNTGAVILDRANVPVVGDFVKLYAEAYSASVRALDSVKYLGGSGTLSGRLILINSDAVSCGDCDDANNRLRGGFGSGTGCESLLD